MTTHVSERRSKGFIGDAVSCPGVALSCTNTLFTTMIRRSCYCVDLQNKGAVENFQQKEWRSAALSIWSDGFQTLVVCSSFRFYMFAIDLLNLYYDSDIPSVSFQGSLLLMVDSSSRRSCLADFLKMDLGKVITPRPCRLL